MYRRLKTITGLFVLTVLASPSAVWADPAGWPKGILKGIDAMKKMQTDGFHV